MPSAGSDDDDDSDMSDDEEDAVISGGTQRGSSTAGSNGSRGSDGLKKSRAGAMSSAMAGLSVGGSERYDDSSTPPGGKRGRAPPLGMLERQDSFDVTPTQV